jgi:hypothetical protein
MLDRIRSRQPVPEKEVSWLGTIGSLRYARRKGHEYAVESLKGARLQRFNAAIREIERDPGWREGRVLAPASSEHSGAILDFSATRT